MSDDHTYSSRPTAIRLSSRRRFISALGLLAAAGGATSLLAACGPASAPTPATTTAPPAAPTTAGPAPTTAAAGAAPTSAATTAPGANAAVATTAPAGRVPTAAVASAATGTPKRGGELKAAMQVDATSLDPHLSSSYSSSLVIEQVYSGLIQFDDSMNIIPDLAESWTVSTDGLVYDFKLRKGVKFHNGRDFVADDVVYSLNRVKNPDGGSPRSYLLEDVKSIMASGADAVRITMNKPFAALLSHLDTFMAVVPKEEVDKNTDLSKVMVGTGPFKFVEFVPNTHAKLVRYDAYHESGKPYLDALTWTPIPDDTTRTANIKTSSVDFADQIAQKDIKPLQGESGVQLARGESTLHDYLMLNTTRKPFSDVRVRQAIAYTLDRKLMTDTILFGFGTPMDGGIIPSWHWANADLHLYSKPDLAKAKQLLSDAGYPSGFQVTIGAGSNYSAQVQAAEMIKDQLKQIGIDVTPNPQEWGTYIDNVVTKKDFDAAIIGWIGAIDPDDWMYSRFHTGEKWNTTGYSNTQVDKLLEQGRATPDQAMRKKLYNQADQMIVSDAPFVFFYLYDQYEALRDYVRGYAHMANNSKNTFKKTWIDK
jgi:peptide/nickel transport system substrate-binding protein